MTKNTFQKALVSPCSAVDSLSWLCEISPATIKTSCLRHTRVQIYSVHTLIRWEDARGLATFGLACGHELLEHSSTPGFPGDRRADRKRQEPCEGLARLHLKRRKGTGCSYYCQALKPLETAELVVQHAKRAESVSRSYSRGLSKRRTLNRELGAR